MKMCVQIKGLIKDNKMSDIDVAILIIDEEILVSGSNTSMKKQHVGISITKAK